MHLKVSPTNGSKVGIQRTCIEGNPLWTRSARKFCCVDATLPIKVSTLFILPLIYSLDLFFETRQSISEEIMENYSKRGQVDKNIALVEYLKQNGTIKSKKVAEVMEAIDRGLFVPDGVMPYVDTPMAIGYNATISAPHMHATCLELLEEHLKPGMRALDVGSGTGYLTACFAMMVGPQGRVIGVEHIPELVDSSIEHISQSAAASLLKEGSLSVHVSDGRLGWPEFAPYDAIHVGAAAPEIPRALIEQLKPGGRLVIPVGTYIQELKVVDKKDDGSICVRNELAVRYVPLTSKDAQLND